MTRLPRSRRLIVTSALAAGSLLSMYAAALRQVPSYAAVIAVPSVTAGCTPGSTEVATAGDLEQAVLTSVDDSVICLTASINLTSDLRIDDTSITLEGTSSDIVLRPRSGGQILLATFTGAADDTLVVRDLTLADSNFTVLSGTAIRALGYAGGHDRVEFDGVVVRDNDGTALYGGAVYIKNMSDVSVTDSTFTGNRGRAYGAALDLRDDTSITIAGSTFRENETLVNTTDGGAVYIKDSIDILITDSIFTDNNAGRAGGGVSLDLHDGIDDTVTISYSIFTHNLSGNDGGAVYAYTDGDVTVSNVIATRNYSATRGGGIYAKGAFGDLLLEGVTLTDDSAANGGGALIAFLFSDVTIDTSVMSGNDSGGRGGAILASNLIDVSILDTTIADNSAVDEGGGFAIGAMSSLTVTSSTVSGNSSGAFGGGGMAVLYPAANGSWTNSTISGNSATGAGGGLALYYGTHAVDFTTISGNTGSQGGGINVDDSTAMALDNSIVAGNSAATGADAWVGDDTTSFASTYSLFTSAGSVRGATVTGGTNLLGAPLLNALANNGGVTLTRLPQWNSPAVMAGDPSWSVSPAYDQRGFGYPRDAGGRVSMGAIQGASPQPPDPTPSVPAGPPRDAAAEAGDRSADVTWSTPSSSGTFPISNYEVQSVPSSEGCIVPASELACSIDALENGTAYTFRVRALTGAGWGPWSEATQPVTPRRPTSLMISGMREGREVQVNGTSTGLAGHVVTPWIRFPGEDSYREGTGNRTVSVDGTFSWRRDTGKKIYVYFRADDDIRSNRVIISAR